MSPYPIHWFEAEGDPILKGLAETPGWDECDLAQRILLLKLCDSELTVE